ncbi:MAG: tRNA (N(6)-L-threonylcarbamoyladenosine(37)-C(2))-methylthiotransferase MtaB [Actinomycetota bacterium]
MTKVAFTTLGCRLNQAESDAMAEDLATQGVEVATGAESPDLVVINTCTVTREATKASRQAIRRAVKRNPEAKVVVIGCYAVSNPDEIEAIEGVDAILSNDDKESFLEALAERPQPLLQIGMGTTKKRIVPHRVRANLKAQTGCDEWCSFCIIPTTRGPLRSLDEDRLIAEARAKVEAGARELVLTGVHLGKYRYEQQGDERDLVRLMRRILDIDGVWRLRLSSILSRHLTDEVVDFIADEPRVCRWLHVPLQAGDDEVLKAMNRPYDISGYLESVDRATRRIEGLTLATDIIVGFPGESDEAFERTMEVVRRVRFSKLHVFRYSARPETAAAEMAQLEIAPEVKRGRSRRLIQLGNEIRGQFLQAHIGCPVEVLVEEERRVDDVMVCSGQTDDFIRVWFERGATESLLGQIVKVQGLRVRADGLEAAVAPVGASSKGRAT